MSIDRLVPLLGIVVLALNILYVRSCARKGFTWVKIGLWPTRIERKDEPEWFRQSVGSTYFILWTIIGLLVLFFVFPLPWNLTADMLQGTRPRR